MCCTVRRRQWYVLQAACSGIQCHQVDVGNNASIRCHDSNWALLSALARVWQPYGLACRAPVRCSGGWPPPCRAVPPGTTTFEDTDPVEHGGSKSEQDGQVCSGFGIMP